MQKGNKKMTNHQNNLNFLRFVYLYSKHINFDFSFKILFSKDNLYNK